MSFVDFDMENIKARLGLNIHDCTDLFSMTTPISASPVLVHLLAETQPLALAISTQKARSELITVPILLEARRQAGRPVSFFSGIDFSVDPAKGLTGTCDFLLGLSPEQFFVEAPVIVVVEAKNDNIKAGLGQCIAEMTAARIFNERSNPSGDVSSVFGVVTTGGLWKFLVLDGNTVLLDFREYHVSQLDQVLGILISMLRLEVKLNREPRNSLRG